MWLGGSHAAVPQPFVVSEMTLSSQPGQDWSEELVTALKSVGIEPTRQGLRQYLRDFLPSADAEQRIRALINQLGSRDYSQRYAATQALALISPTERHLIEQATQSDDLEVAVRARQVLRAMEQSAQLRRLSRILALMDEHRLHGFTRELDEVYQALEPEHALQRQFEKLLVEVAQPRDLERFHSRLSDSSSHGREVYLRVIARLQPDQHRNLFAQLANEDEDVNVRLAAASELAAIPDPRCLEALLKLLEHPTVQIRSHAGQKLRVVTGQRLGFVAVADEDHRREAIDRWQKWLAEAGPDWVLFPLDRSRQVFRERLVVSSYSQGIVVEMDMAGKILREIADVGRPMGVFGAADGRILVCDYGGKQVLVYDDQNQLVFQKELKAGPLSGELLENGNVLIGVSSTKQVLELDPKGEVVWKVDVPDRVNVVQRTPEGTTLVSMLGAGKIIELDAGGKTIFELEVNKPNGVRRLENGNTLVCLYDLGEVREYDPSKQVVWKVIGLQKPSRAQRLPDGTTVVYHREGIDFFDDQQKKIRKIKNDKLRHGDIGSLHFF